MVKAIPLLDISLNIRREEIRMINHRNTTEPIELGTIDVTKAGKNAKMYLGDINGDGRMEIVMVQPDGGIDNRYVPHQLEAITAFDLEGQVLWQVGTPVEHPGGPGSDYPIQIYDIDRDGILEILCVMNKRFLVLDGKTGEVKKDYELPDDEAHDCIVIANLTGGDHPQDILLKDRYHCMWALDKDFDLLWTHEGNLGHFPWAFDFNRDGRDELMVGYDFLSADGKVQWSCQNLEDHADCIWVGPVTDTNSDDYEIVVGGSVTVLYDRHGKELWRYEGSIESQHVCIGKFRKDSPGLQIAGVDRIKRGDGRARKGKDGIFLLDSSGKELLKENRTSDGWLTIIETMRNWDGHELDYILAYRRGGGINPTLYDGYLQPVVEFPIDGYVVYGDLVGTGKEQVIIYKDQKAHIYGNEFIDLQSKNHEPLTQDKRLYSITLYPGGEYHI